MKKLSAVTLLDVLPESILQDPKLYASAQALSAQLQAVTAATREVLHLPRLDELSGTVLDYLAEQFHLDCLEPLFLSGTTDEMKRDWIRKSIPWHRIKGTPAAVLLMAQDAFDAPEILEWFDYGGEPYHFKIRSHGFKHPSEQWPTFWRGLCTAKNVRSWPDNFELIYNEEPVPVYAGIADLHGGKVEVSLDKPKFFNSETRAFAATADLLSGNKAISLQRPKLKFGGKFFVGQALTKSGYIRIGTSTKPHDDEDIIAHSWTAEVFAQAVNLVHGRQVWSMSRPRDQQVNLTAGTVDVQTGSMKLKPSTLRDVQTTLTAGQVLTKSGEIRIDTSTKPTSTDNFFGHSSTAHVCAQTADVQSGNVTVTDNKIPKRYAVVRIGQVLTCAGFVTIGASDSDWHDLPEDGDWLKLRFRFPNLGKRFVTLPDPRDDLEKDDIREVGNFAAEKGMLLNSDKEPTSGIDLAMLIKRNIRKIF